MSLLNDDILNKYLDGDLDSETRRKVSNQLEFSDEDRRRYLELQAVHSGLRKMKPYEVSTEFTSLLMSRLLKNKKAKKEQKIFILSISSVFAIACLIIIGFAFSLLFTYSGSSVSQSSSVTNDFMTMIKSIGDSIADVMNKRNISIIGSIISFGVVVSAYFFFENLKQSKERLSKLSDRF